MKRKQENTTVKAKKSKQNGYFPPISRSITDYFQVVKPVKTSSSIPINNVQTPIVIDSDEDLEYDEYLRCLYVQYLAAPHLFPIETPIISFKSDEEAIPQGDDSHKHGCFIPEFEMSCDFGPIYIPDDIWIIIGGLLPLTDLLNLCRTGKYMRGLEWTIALQDRNWNGIIFPSLEFNSTQYIYALVLKILSSYDPSPLIRTILSSYASTCMIYDGSDDKKDWIESWLKHLPTINCVTWIQVGPRWERIEKKTELLEKTSIYHLRERIVGIKDEDLLDLDFLPNVTHVSIDIYADQFKYIVPEPVYPQIQSLELEIIHCQKSGDILSLLARKFPQVRKIYLELYRVLSEDGFPFEMISAFTHLEDIYILYNGSSVDREFMANQIGQISEKIRKVTMGSLVSRSK